MTRCINMVTIVLATTLRGAIVAIVAQVSGANKQVASIVNGCWVNVTTANKNKHKTHTHTQNTDKTQTKHTKTTRSRSLHKGFWTLRVMKFENDPHPNKLQGVRRKRSLSFLSFDPLRPMSVQQTAKTQQRIYQRASQGRLDNMQDKLEQIVWRHLRRRDHALTPFTVPRITSTLEDADKRALTKHRRHASRRHWRRRQACTDQTQAKLTNISKGAQHERHRSPQLAAKRRCWGTMP